MSQLLLQVVIVVAFGAFCFGCGYLTAFIVSRNQWRDEMIKRGVARYNWQTGKWEWGGHQKKGSRDIECPHAASRRPGPSRNSPPASSCASAGGLMSITKATLHSS